MSCDGECFPRALHFELYGGHHCFCWVLGLPPDAADTLDVSIVRPQLVTRSAAVQSRCDTMHGISPDDACPGIHYPLVYEEQGCSC
jgi:hypothetical protein